MTFRRKVLSCAAATIIVGIALLVGVPMVGEETWGLTMPFFSCQKVNARTDKITADGELIGDSHPQHLRISNSKLHARHHENNPGQKISRHLSNIFRKKSKTKTSDKESSKTAKSSKSATSDGKAKKQPRRPRREARLCKIKGRCSRCHDVKSCKKAMKINSKCSWNAMQGLCELDEHDCHSGSTGMDWCPEIRECIPSWAETCPIVGDSFEGPTTLDCNGGRCSSEEKCSWTDGSATFGTYYWATITGAFDVPAGCNVACTGCDEDADEGPIDDGNIDTTDGSEGSDNDLPFCNFNGVAGQCMASTSCGQSGGHAYDGFCPGNDTIKCCISLPDCEVDSRFGKCTFVGECPGESKPGQDCPGDVSTVQCCLHENEMSNFTRATFYNGTANDTKVERSADNSSDLFFIKYNVHFASAGVVSLNGIASDVDFVSCSTEGSVNINLLQDFGMSSLAEMYPLGSILAIDNHIFGPCNLQEEEFDEDNEEERLIINTTSHAHEYQDSFLLIQDVSGTPINALVRGIPASYYALFDNASIEITKLHDNTTLLERSLAYNAPIAIEAEVFTLGPFSVTAKGTRTNKGEFLSFKVEWDIFGLELSYRTIDEIEFTIELDTKFALGPMSVSKTWDLLSVPLYALPRISFTEKLQDKHNSVKESQDQRDNQWRFELPDFKLGVYFEIPLIAQLDVVALEKDLSTGATYTYNTGRKDITYSINGGWTDLKPRQTTKVIRQASKDLSFKDPLSSWGDTPMKLKLGAFLGVRPQVALYVSLFFARISVEVGVEVAGELAYQALGSSDAFRPIEASNRGLYAYGHCDSCHKLHFIAAAKIKNAGIYVGLSPVKIKTPWFKWPHYKIAPTMSWPLPGNPSLQWTLATACYFPQTEGGSCSKSIALPNFPDLPGISSSVYTDPHLKTFDGLAYDCQASGDFVMSKSDINPFEIQARFSGPNTRGSVTTGIAIAFAGSPTLQVSTATALNQSASFQTLIGNSQCPILLYVNGIERDILSGTGLLSASVSLAIDGRVEIATSIGIRLSFKLRRSSTFGCYLEFLTTFLPDTLITNGDVKGLLGTPNQSPFDDWVNSSSGIPLSVPTTRSERLYEKAYNYCVTNWCVTSQNQSLFTYDNGTSFQDVDRCSAPYQEPPDLNDASQELRDLCGRDESCLIDGLVGDIDDATSTLSAQIQSADLFVSPFRAEPSSIPVDSSTNVLLTIHSNENHLEEFAVYRVDGDSGRQIIGGLQVSLRDDGSAMTSDVAAKDGIFSNVLALYSNSAGERYSFVAIPVVNSTEQPQSAVVLLDGVRSYSSSYGLVGNMEWIAHATINSTTGKDLLVEYTWPIEQRDLDTATEFLDETVGYGCGYEKQYITSISEDDTHYGGKETIIVRIGKARSDGVWMNSTDVNFRAGWHTVWHATHVEGPATLRLSLQDAVTKEEVELTRLSMAIDPGHQSGCASTWVATLSVVDHRETTSLRLSKINTQRG